MYPVCISIGCVRTIRYIENLNLKKKLCVGITIKSLETSSQLEPVTPYSHYPGLLTMGINPGCLTRVNSTAETTVPARSRPE